MQLGVVDCEVVVLEVLQAMLNQREVVNAKHAITLEQLCLLLLVVTLHVLLLVDLVPFSIHLDLVSLRLLLLRILNDQVIGVICARA